VNRNRSPSRQLVRALVQGVSRLVEF